MAVNEEFFADKRVVILGLARQGSALARFMAGCGASVVVSDLCNLDDLAGESRSEVDSLAQLGVEFVLGEHPLTLLDGCDLLAPSGGVPLQIAIVQEAIARGIPLSNDSLLTLQLARAKGLGPLVAITGSSGKTTTTTLVGEMLAASGQPVHVGGNIGTPLIDRLDRIKPGEPIVLELSSFQLELFDAATAQVGKMAQTSLTGIGPDVAAILNITPNHLDRHKDMAAYTAAKLNLIRFLPPQAKVVLSKDDPVTAAIGENPSTSPTGNPVSDWVIPNEWGLDETVSTIQKELFTRDQPITFFGQLPDVASQVADTKSQLNGHRGTDAHENRSPDGAWLVDARLFLEGQEVCHQKDLLLRGSHNVSNTLAAAAISKAAGATIEEIRQVATQFTGVAHRLEVVSENDGVIWINDSIATSPERALAGLRSFDVDKQAVILLAGGKDKNLPWQALADEVLYHVRYLIGFGAFGPEFVRLVQERGGFSQQSVPSSATARHLDQAIELAARLVESERAADPTREVIVLLSPGGTSYDAYRDFEERGEHFRRLVKALAN